MKNLNETVKNLLDLCEASGLCDPADRAYHLNALLAIMKEDAYEEPATATPATLEETLGALCDCAYEKGLLPENTVSYRDLFDTSLMGALTPRPSEVIRRFFDLLKESPEKATDYFYALCLSSDYIRSYRIVKDVKWKTASRYGDIDITINLSKPEKDPRAIAAAKSLPQSGYPKCLLCHENEGYAGTLRSPARQNLRQIPLTLGGESWYMQYSPYVYYNEHSIVLSAAHTPMRICEDTFRRALDFVTVLPHYFVGSNADLPIVGGSILSHDHMQGGRYTFAMEKAEVTHPVTFRDYPDVTGGIVKWPMSVIRLDSESKESLVALATRILDKWRAYTDEEAFVFAETEGEKHNTVTPIARRRGKLYELDLVLRNNVTTPEHPLGVYHPHAERHHIKKENIGLIEVMGLAVLPARLKEELALLGEYMAEGKDPAENETLAKHADFAREILSRRTVTRENAESVLREEVGGVFVKVLEDAGVYKCTEEGRRAMLRFLATV